MLNIGVQTVAIRESLIGRLHIITITTIMALSSGSTSINETNVGPPRLIIHKIAREHTMKSSLNESTPRKRQKVIGNDDEKEEDMIMHFKDLPQDAILVVFTFNSFPTLCRVKPVCQWWMKSVGIGIGIRLGKKAFVTREELLEAIGKYCGDKVKYAEELAVMYGWPIGKWDVSKVTNFTKVFEHQSSFNEDIREWDVSNGTTFRGMFWGASLFNQDISEWNVSNGTLFASMFDGCFVFNQDLSKWNTEKAQDMGCMFRYAAAFNGNISIWDTGKVEDMSGMFANATSFNGDISKWETGNVKTVSSMFNTASSFNQDISSWNTSNVTNMAYMFSYATSFCQDLSSWNVARVRRRRGMFNGSLSCVKSFPKFVT
mmetsp:Transcript_11643/g.17904  ORF Transcript_11643/g.17904 Transcript_11643/m.17904 type:complete len:373 (+) Transcript_11643:99-1217(+)